MPDFKPANEVSAMFMNDVDAWRDRCNFVHNLGEILKETREGICSVELLEGDLVLITFKGGHTETVNVRADSYIAIIRDVTKII